MIVSRVEFFIKTLLISRQGPAIKYRGGGGGGYKNFFLSTAFQWPTHKLFDKIGVAHPWSGTEKTSDPSPNQNQ